MQKLAAFAACRPRRTATPLVDPNNLVQELTAGCKIPLRVNCTYFGAFLTIISETREGSAMDRSARLHLVGRITYYVGWIALVCGGLVHLNIAKSLFFAMSLTKRNLFEVCLVCFVICMASEVRALGAAEKALPSVVKRQAAA
jgi:hypothetical protein